MVDATPFFVRYDKGQSTYFNERDSFSERIVCVLRTEFVELSVLARA